MLFIGLAAISPAFLSGCGIFSPEKDGGGGGPPPPPPVEYLIPSRPNFALENMRRAYVAKDSVEADSVYHPDYQGQSAAVDDPVGTTPLVFTKPEEVSHIGALRLNPNVTDIVFNMGQFDSWERQPSLDVTHPEWASITISRGINLEITTPSTTYTVGSNDFFEYQFTPITPAAGSPTDTLWRIIRWRELKGAGG